MLLPVSESLSGRLRGLDVPCSWPAGPPDSKSEGSSLHRAGILGWVLPCTPLLGLISPSPTKAQEWGLLLHSPHTDMGGTTL